MTSTETGGVSLKCSVPEDEFGSVQLGMLTVFYVGGGDVIILDSAGNVISSNGVVHTQFMALDVRELYNERLVPPGDSSRIHVD